MEIVKLPSSQVWHSQHQLWLIPAFHPLEWKRQAGSYSWNSPSACWGYEPSAPYPLQSVMTHKRREECKKNMKRTLSWCSKIPWIWTAQQNWNKGLAHHLDLINFSSSQGPHEKPTSNCFLSWICKLLPCYEASFWHLYHTREINPSPCDYSLNQSWGNG